MLGDYLPGVNNTGQVDPLVPGYQFLAIPFKGTGLTIGQGQAKLSGAMAQELLFNQSDFSRLNKD